MPKPTDSADHEVRPEATAGCPRPQRDPDEPSRLLHSRFLAGDEEAVSEVKYIAAAVVRFRGLFVKPDDRTDVVQETMLDLFREAQTREFDDDGQFQAFVRTIAYRRCVDCLRRRRRSREDGDRLGEPSRPPDNSLFTAEKRELGTLVLSRLGKPCLELFALRAGLRLTYSEIGLMTGKKPGAVRVQAHECLKKARRILSRIQRPNMAARTKR